MLYTSPWQGKHLIRIAFLNSRQKFSEILSITLVKEGHRPGTYWFTGQEARIGSCPAYKGQTCFVRGLS